MHGHVRLIVERRGDRRSVVRDLVQSPPLAVRRCHDGFYLVATAASPVGSDRVAVEVEVGPGAEAVVRTVGATIAYGGRGAVVDFRATVADGATLRWLPGPTIATVGCALEVRSVVEMAGDAEVVWREELLLGRHGEGPGRLSHRLRVDAGGCPLLRHDLAVGPGAPGWDGPAVLGDHRALGLSLAAGRAPAPPAGAGRGWATMPLEGPGTLTLAVAADHPSLLRRMARAGAPRDGREAPPTGCPVPDATPVAAGPTPGWPPR